MRVSWDRIHKFQAPVPGGLNPRGNCAVGLTREKRSGVCTADHDSWVFL